MKFNDGIGLYVECMNCKHCFNPSSSYRKVLAASPHIDVYCDSCGDEEYTYEDSLREFWKELES